MKQSRFLPLGLSIVSGILLSLPWYQSMPGLIILVAFVPLLLAEYLLTSQEKSTKNIVLHVAIAMAIWTVIDAWWITNAAVEGLIAAIIINTTLGSMVFGLFHITKKRLGNTAGYISLVFFWIAYEHFYTNAEISWPWLTLGNAFAHNVHLIQWYEYTGVLGGTLWALVTNIFLFFAIQALIKKNRNQLLLWATWSIAATIVPIIISAVIFRNVKETGVKATVVILQPNIDPYNEKFNGMSDLEQTTILLSLAQEASDSTVDFYIAPETALQGQIMEDNLMANGSVALVKHFIGMHPDATFIVGMTSYKTYSSIKKPTPTARKIPGQNLYYDRFNSALQIDRDGFQIYHKSKLVVGVEKMPYINRFPFIENLALNLGGTTGSLGTQSARTVFYSHYGQFRAAPAICYESVYGEYFAEWIKNGANIGIVITNDGWWGNTPGYHQHLSYSSLRAIETRRYIARSANTGISAIINTKGEIVQQLGWWKRGFIKGEVVTNDKITFYVKAGDYLGRIATMLALLMLPVLLVQYLRRKSDKEN
ncbi:MAG TPA: apolipoprotein N-acyltransferase [Williamwhitmania sp.]|nr:apolipoprotein N-acyltransferase [Williamwhitmania sp.]